MKNKNLITGGIVVLIVVIGFILLVGKFTGSISGPNVDCDDCPSGTCKLFSKPSTTYGTTYCLRLSGEGSDKCSSVNDWTYVQDCVINGGQRCSDAGGFCYYPSCSSGGYETVDGDCTLDGYSAGYECCSEVAPEECDDSDSNFDYPQGKNYRLKGTVTYTFGGSTLTVIDECRDSKHLDENYCTLDNTRGTIFNLLCTYECEDGACTSGPVCDPDDIYKQYCDGDRLYNDCDELVYDCGAQGDTCGLEGGFYHCITTPPQNECEDSDGGKVFRVKGTVTYTFGEETKTAIDVCDPSSGYLVEQYCTVNKERGTLYNILCTYGCEDGACQNAPPPPPDCEGGCDDDNLCTDDKCVDNKCIYEPKVCDEGQYCDTADGQCKIGGGCSEANPCIERDGYVVSCIGGQCKYVPVITCRAYQELKEGQCKFSLSALFTSSGIKDFWEDFKTETIIGGIGLLVIVGLILYMVFRKKQTMF